MQRFIVAGDLRRLAVQPLDHGRHCGRIEPVGPRLSRVVYTTKLDGTTKDATVKALKRKYGPPNGGDPSINFYGWAGEHRPFDSATSTLTVIIDADSMMATLLQSGDDFPSAKRRVQERAQAIAASHGGVGL